MHPTNTESPEWLERWTNFQALVANCLSKTIWARGGIVTSTVQSPLASEPADGWKVSQVSVEFHPGPTPLAGIALLLEGKPDNGFSIRIFSRLLESFPRYEVVDDKPFQPIVAEVMDRVSQLVERLKAGEIGRCVLQYG
jgi:hypothetical protein